MDSQTLGIGVFFGVLLGALLIGVLLRGRARAYERRIRRLEREATEARRTIELLRSESAARLELVARNLGQTAGDAVGAVSVHAQQQSEVSRQLAQLAARWDAGSGADAETDAVAIAGAQHATEELSGRERHLTDALAALRRRFEVVDSVLDTIAAEDRMTEHKMDDLVAAAAESLGTASSMDNVIRNLQETAAETAEHSTQVAGEAERGYRAVHRTLDEIERIRNLTGVARTKIEALGERVSDIGHIVKVIQEITEKTNLLALNASIIAAQAGEHGRSFAVVASEIKALAQRTAASTKEISDQIRGVQEESERAQAAMVDGVAAVGEGFQVAISAGDALDAIRQGAKGAQRKMQQMTRTLRQQSRVAQQVVDAASAVSERAGSFATAIRGQSSATDRLRGAAVDLQSGAKEIADAMTEHGSSTTLCVDTIGTLSERLALLRRREHDLRRAMRDLETGAQGAEQFGDEMATRWAAITEATGRLRDSVETLRRA